MSKIGKKTKAEIKKAVEEIPSLVMKQKTAVNDLYPEDEKSNTEKKTAPITNKKNKGLMWFGVITVTIIILGMWAWNMNTALKDFGKNDVHNQNPFYNIGDELKNALKTIPTETTSTEKATADKEEKIEVNEQTKENLKNSLLQILNNTTSTSSTE